MMSVARAMGEMMKKGWKPRRSVLFVSWDGEEQGLLGSTEWVEDLDGRAESEGGGVRQSGRRRRRVELQQQRRALADAVRPRAGAVDPARAAQSKSLYDGWLERAREQSPARDGQPVLEAPPVGALGSGSDYTAFLDHIGVASLDMGLNGRGGDGSYHSTYDNPTWFKKYIDPQFKFSVLAAQVTGVALLRLADAEVLPFDYEAYGRQILEYVGEIEKQATTASPESAKSVDFAGMRAAAEAFAKAGADVRARGETLLAAVGGASRRPGVRRHEPRG